MVAAKLPINEFKISHTESNLKNFSYIRLKIKNYKSYNQGSPYHKGRKYGDRDKAPCFFSSAKYGAET